MPSSSSRRRRRDHSCHHHRHHRSDHHYRSHHRRRHRSPHSSSRSSRDRDRRESSRSRRSHRRHRRQDEVENRRRRSRRRSESVPSKSLDNKVRRVLRSPGPPPNLLKSTRKDNKDKDRDNKSPKRSCCSRRSKSRRRSVVRSSISRNPPPKIRIAPPNPEMMIIRAKRRSRTGSPKSKLSKVLPDDCNKKSKSIEKLQQVDLRVVIEEAKNKRIELRNRSASRKRSGSRPRVKSEKRDDPKRRSQSKKPGVGSSSAVGQGTSQSRDGHHHHSSTTRRRSHEDSKSRRHGKCHDSHKKSSSSSCKHTKIKEETGGNKSPAEAVVVAVVKQEKLHEKSEGSDSNKACSQSSSASVSKVCMKKRSISYASISSDSSRSCSTCSSSSCSTCSSSSNCSGTSKESGSNANDQKQTGESIQLQNLTILTQQVEKENLLNGTPVETESSGFVGVDAASDTQVQKVKVSKSSSKATALAALICEEMKLSGKVDAMRKALNKEVENMTDFKDMLHMVSEKTDEYLGNITTYDPSRKKVLRQDLVKFLQSSGTMNSLAVDHITSQLIPKDVLKSPILSMVQDVLAKKSADLLVLKAGKCFTYNE